MGLQRGLRALPRSHHDLFRRHIRDVPGRVKPRNLVSQAQFIIISPSSFRVSMPRTKSELGISPISIKTPPTPSTCSCPLSISFTRMPETMPVAQAPLVSDAPS